MKNLDLEESNDTNENFNRNVNGTRYLTNHLKRVPTKNLYSTKSRNGTASHSNLYKTDRE